MRQLIDRRAQEEREDALLAPYAMRSALSRGRRHPEEEDPTRTRYQRDRDRVIHSSSFRRLEYKTQVFVNHEGDNYRTRLTHSLEGAQIGRGVARSLGLNEELTECLVLGHDLGHTPFGHLGEEALSPFLQAPFRHNEQSLRVVDYLEDEGRGLNLTWEVRDGIVNHTWSMQIPSTFEGQVARFADRIAYVNHDVDDAIRAGILTEKDLPSGVADVLGQTHAGRINTLVHDLVEKSNGAEQIQLSPSVLSALGELRDFLFDRVYLRPEARVEQEKAVALVRSLFSYYLGHPEAVPAEYRTAPGDLPTHVADYIAGMTDRFALRTYEQLFLPQGWLL
jgi:dGTPase